MSRDVNFNININVTSANNLEDLSHGSTGDMTSSLGQILESLGRVASELKSIPEMTKTINTSLEAMRVGIGLAGKSEAQQVSAKQNFYEQYQKAKNTYDVLSQRFGAESTRTPISKFAENAFQSLEKHRESTDGFTRKTKEASAALDLFNKTAASINRNNLSLNSVTSPNTLASAISMAAVGGALSQAQSVAFIPRTYDIMSQSVSAAGYNALQVQRENALRSGAGNLATLASAGVGFIGGGPGGAAAGSYLGTLLSSSLNLQSAKATAQLINQGLSNQLALATGRNNASNINALIESGEGYKVPSYVLSKSSLSRYYRNPDAAQKLAESMTNEVAGYSKATQVDYTSLIPVLAAISQKSGTDESRGFFRLESKIGSIPNMGDASTISRLLSMTPMGFNQASDWLENTSQYGQGYQDVAASMKTMPVFQKMATDIVLGGLVGKGVNVEGLSSGNRSQLSQYATAAKDPFVEGVLQSQLGTSVDQQLTQALKGSAGGSTPSNTNPIKINNVVIQADNVHLPDSFGVHNQTSQTLTSAQLQYSLSGNK